IALVSSGARVTLCHRRKELSRPRPENLRKLRLLEKDPAAPVGIEHPVSDLVTTASGPFSRGAPKAAGSLGVVLSTEVVRIEAEHVVLKRSSEGETRLENDVVFTMLGREAPLPFFRRSGIPIRGEWTAAMVAGFAAFFLFCVFLYNWNANGAVNRYFQEHRLFPYDLDAIASDPATLLGTLSISLKDPGFYYSLAYSTAILAFRIKRIRRPPTPPPHPVRDPPDRRPDAGAVDPALPAPVHRAAVARPQRRLRHRFRADGR